MSILFQENNYIVFSKSIKGEKTKFEEIYNKIQTNIDLDKLVEISDDFDLQYQTDKLSDKEHSILTLFIANKYGSFKQ